MRQLLIEGLKGALPFIVDRTKFVKESLPNGLKGTRIPGRFSVSDSVNGNNRKYPRKVWEKNTASGSSLQEAIARNAAFGLLEHPKDGIVTLLSPICHIVTEAKLIENGEVHGSILIVDTEDGKKLMALIDSGYNPMLSSRGFGSLVKENGVDVVQDDYVCEGWDTVIKPSFDNAELQVPRTAPAPVAQLKQESTPVAVANTTAPTTITLTSDVPLVATLVEQTPTTPPPPPTPQPKTTPNPNQPQTGTAPVAAPVADSTTPKSTENMTNITELRTRISQFRSTDATRLNPTQFAEAVAQIANIHQEVANYVAEDAKRNYEGLKLHKELESIEHSWANIQSAPSKAANRLRESLTKTLKVCKMVTEAGLKFKGKLAEQIKQNTRNTALIEELTTNGRGWKALAEKRKAQLDHMLKKYTVACEALDIMAKTYHGDMAEVGGRVITLEFKEKAQTPEIQKAIKEAKTAQDIIALREQLSGKKAAPVTEGKKTTLTTTPPLTEGDPTPPVRGSSNPNRNPRAWNESVGIARRLSESMRDPVELKAEAQRKADAALAAAAK